MKRRSRAVVFVALALATGAALQCGTPVVENIIDAGLDGSLFDSSPPDARADVDIPEGCDCEAPLIALDDRIEALEARVAELEPEPPPDPDTFSMLIGFDGATPSELLVPYSSVYVSRFAHLIDSSGRISLIYHLSINAYSPASRSQISLSVSLPGDSREGGDFNISEALSYSFSARDVSGDGSGRSCSFSLGGTDDSITGRVTMTRSGDRMTGTFQLTMTRETGSTPCSVRITEGSFDVLLSLAGTAGEYVVP